MPGPGLSLKTLPRRWYILFVSVFLFVIVITLFGAPTEVPTVAQVEDAIKHPKMPKVQNPFGYSAHKPPVQANSTSGDVRWYTHWKWKNPFSSSITMDENRAILPPKKNRPPIYTFYDMSLKKDENVREAENKLILAWRRAWWAQGFNPVVLGRPDAMRNQEYERLQRLKLDPALEADIARFLAWGYMGSGILSNWLALPMAPYDDPTLSFLRRGEYVGLTRYDDLETGLFVGDKAAILDAIKNALDGTEKDVGFTMIQSLRPDTWTVDNSHNAIALYTKSAITKKYPTIGEKFNNPATMAIAFEELGRLINYHLQTIWQNSFTSGISVVRILPQNHLTALVEPAVDLARNLTQCADSPIPPSCPPNKPECKSCDPAKPYPMTISPVFRNDSSFFTIGVVPHPYTMTSLLFRRDAIDAKFIRRECKDRDPWLFAATKELLGTEMGGTERITPFKEAVASDWAYAHTMWLTAERETHKDLNWIFGFEIPTFSPAATAAANTTITNPRPPLPKMDNPTLEDPEVDGERALLVKARELLHSRVRQSIMIRQAAEAWNLADTEAWRFARAWSARRRVERLKWEEKEREFAGAKERAKGWGRWLEYVT